MSITDTRKTGTGTTGCGGCGTCSTCTGLGTFTRPRFFAGQLLTETELTALTAYTIGKDRLHNRYLHGAGVVCGLEVTCDGCGPGVLVQPGYALDGLGNDVVVPEPVSVSVAELIAACTASTSAADCDPPRYPRAQGCEEDEQSWCLWVRYREQAGRLVTPLGGSPRPTCSCGSTATASPCGCGATGVRTSTRTTPTQSGCGCGGSRSVGASTTRSSSGCSCGRGAASASTSARAGTDCEPSRISELFDFGVAQIGCSCDTSLGDRLTGTFPARVVACIRSITPLLSRNLDKRMQASALSVLTGASGRADEAGRAAICTLYTNVVELYRRDPLRTQCVLPEELSTIDCSPQGANETSEHYQRRLQAAALALVQLVLLYLRDCVCAAMLPPCPDGCDDRVMLACVTVRAGQVVRICNLSCRRYAGSFVTREYWLPIGPVLSWLAALVCCFPLPTRKLADIPDRDSPAATHRAAAREENIAGEAAREAQPVTLGDLDGVIAALTGDGFALGSLWRRRARAAMARLRPARLLREASTALARDKDTVALAPLLHTDVAEASRTLRRTGVDVHLVEVADRTEALGLDLVPRAAKGEAATLYTMGGVVVGVSGSRPTVSLREAFSPRSTEQPATEEPAAEAPAKARTTRATTTRASEAKAPSRRRTSSTKKSGEDG